MKKKITILKIAFTSALMFFLFNMVSFAQCNLSEDFENMTGSGAYAGANVTFATGLWRVVGHTTMDTNDRYNGKRSIRLRGNANDTCHVTMLFDKPDGLGTLTFKYGSYSGHSNGQISAYYSTDQGSHWDLIGRLNAPSWVAGGKVLQTAEFEVNVPGNIRIKIARDGDLKSSTSVNIDDLCLTDFTCENCVEAPTFNPPSGIQDEGSQVNVTITSATAGATIRYTLNGGDPDESSTEFTGTAIPITQTTVIKAKAWKTGMEPSPVSSASYTFVQGINTLAALRELAPAYNNNNAIGNVVHKFTGEAVITLASLNRNQKYIQDATGAILIDDLAGIMPHADFDIGDKITNISGTLSNYYGMIQFVPTKGGTVSGTNGNVEPEIITLDVFDSLYTNPLQAKFVKVENVKFTTTGNFAANQYYPLQQDGKTYSAIVHLPTNWNADYVGTAIPTLTVSLKGVVHYAYSKNRLIMLSKNDWASIKEINPSTLTLSPNPAIDYIRIATSEPQKMEIYSISGQLVSTEQCIPGDNIISVNHLSKGFYIVKLTDNINGKIQSAKLIVQ